MSDDGVALVSAKHPILVTEEMTEAGATVLAESYDSLGPKHLVERIFIAMCDAAPVLGDLNENALETMVLELAGAHLSDDELTTIRQMLRDYGFEYGLTADPEKVAALASRFGVKR